MINLTTLHKKCKCSWEFPGVPVVRTLVFRTSAEGPGSIPGRGTKIPQAVWHNQKQKKK